MSVSVEVKKLLDRTGGIPLVLAIRAARRLRPDRPRAPTAPRRILLIKLWGIGNLTMVLPLARAVRRAYPDAEIDLLTLPEHRELVDASPFLDRGIYFAHHGLVRPFVALGLLAARLRRRRYDLVLDFEQFLKTTALLTWWARPDRSVGFQTPRQWRHGLYDVSVPHDDRRHMALVFGDVARAAGIDVDGVPPLLAPPPDPTCDRVAKLVESLREPGRPLIVLHVGSGDNFEGRRWPAAHFARLADLLHARIDARFLFTGTAAERALIHDCRSRLGAPSIDLSGQLDLTELTDLLRRVDLLISNDTAPVHLASAVGSPLIGLYGPNTPRLYGPLSPTARAFHRGLSCSPCITNSNAKTSFCRRPICLTSIDPSDVAAAAIDMLSRRAVPRAAEST